MDIGPIDKVINYTPLSPYGNEPFYKKLFKDKKAVVTTMIIVATVIIVVGITGAMVVEHNKSANITPTPTFSESPSPTPTPTEEVSPTRKVTIPPTARPTAAFVTKAPTPTSTPTSTPTPTPTYTPTPTPTRTPNPPRITISYPSEDQTIELGPGQHLCVQDLPNGGDETGLQRKHSINDAAWTAYSTPFTLCFDPIEGLNRFQLQYKNSYNEESVTYTRQFNFHRISVNN